MNDMSFEEIAANLKTLGIDGITEEMVDSFEQETWTRWIRRMEPEAFGDMTGIELTN